MITDTQITVIDFLARTPGFDQLSEAELSRLAATAKPLRFRMGQAMVTRESLPQQWMVLMDGQARLLGYPPGSQVPETIERLQSGAMIGLGGLLRKVPCETVIASTESLCLSWPAAELTKLMEQEAHFAAALQAHPTLAEVYHLIGAHLAGFAKSPAQLKPLAVELHAQSVLQLVIGALSLGQLDSTKLWFVSGGERCNYAPGSCLPPIDSSLQAQGTGAVRLVGVPQPARQAATPIQEQEQPLSAGALWSAATFAPESSVDEATETPSEEYPFVRGQGAVDVPLACFQMLAKYWGLAFRRDTLRRALVSQYQRAGSISLPLCGAMAELLGIVPQLVEVPASSIAGLPTPAMVPWEDGFAVVYRATPKEVILAVPDQGILRRTPEQMRESWGEKRQVLLLAPSREASKQRFSLRWFIPAIKQHRKALLIVLVTSLFVQLFGLANPLITQVIIDKVLVQNGFETLNILGALLIGLAIFEALLTGLRTTLFVDTTNRIDFALGSQVIDHLLRLPLRYFQKRPVGELASRVNELENIRSFLTGTALTVVLDAIFSVIYIVVMLFYSWLLTLVALATVPLFAILGVIVAPIIQQQTRERAERNAETQSYLVEAVSGIETVKAQSIELGSRWQWQTRYGRYIGASFKNILTSTTAGSLNGFLNKLSGLLLLWVGAYLVLDGKLTLGQLIAFRIIAGYTTSPLLRLVQLWQNFQETALSLERLADILDAPQETEVAGRSNIPMSEITGAVRYEQISFRFRNSTAPQLNNVSLEIPAGTFVGVVGQSGAGKSTLTKLLARLYEPDSGRILVDEYDIAKVELYSLRRQIGVVLQDTLLFDGTVQENIALTNPDATSEEVIEAARLACAHDFVMSLPAGYNTRVGERGSALSGGQRQRIAIARTILQNPRLLILDEATSALDYVTESQVCANLGRTFKGRTVFFVTHRLASIQNADLIVVMDQGSVVEQGTHEQLLELQGRYFCLHQQQQLARA
jgi:HlyB family type I secretion system ABC transporter